MSPLSTAAVIKTNKMATFKSRNQGKDSSVIFMSRCEKFELFCANDELFSFP